MAFSADPPRRVPGSRVWVLGLGPISPTDGQQMINAMIAALGDHGI
jgi:hypothetical protein